MTKRTGADNAFERIVRVHGSTTPSSANRHHEEEDRLIGHRAIRVVRPDGLHSRVDAFRIGGLAASHAFVTVEEPEAESND